MARVVAIKSNTPHEATVEWGAANENGDAYELPSEHKSITVGFSNVPVLLLATKDGKEWETALDTAGKPIDYEQIPHPNFVAQWHLKPDAYRAVKPGPSGRCEVHTNDYSNQHYKPN